MDISALLAALKNAEGSKPSLSDPEMSGDAPDPADDAKDEDMNAKIVGVLQTEYPKIYAKIAAQVGDQDDQGDGMPSMGDASPEMMQ